MKDQTEISSEIEIEVLPPRRLIEKRPAEESVAQRTKGKGEKMSGII